VYVPGVPLASAADRGRAAARDSALGAAPPRESSGRVEGGRPLIWVSSAGAHPSARKAYEYTIEGRQIIVDAGSGKVIFRRDRRTF
jgi:hypothetical protein